MPSATQAIAHPSPTGAAQEEEFSFLDLAIVLVRGSRWILSAAALFAFIAAVVSLVLPSMYTATTVVLPPQNASAGAALMSQLTSMGPMASMAGGSLGIKNPNDMYVGMFRSRSVEDSMVRRFSLMKEYGASTMSGARREFEKRLQTDGAAKDGMIHISISDRNPGRAAEIANGYVEEYRKLAATLALTEASQRRLFFEQQLAEAKDNLGNAEQALKKTQQDTGVLQLDSQARGLIESAATLRAQIAAKEVEIRGIQSFAAEENPDLMMARQQLAGWQAELARLTAQSTSGNDLLLSKGQVPEVGLEYARKIRDVKYYDTIFELLAKQFEMAKLDEARQGAPVQVMDIAVPPDRRSSPRRLLIVLVATVAGLLVGVFLVFARQGLAIARRNPEDRARLDLLGAMLSRGKAL